MRQNLAIFVSYLFHPLFLPLYISGLFFRLNSVKYAAKLELFYQTILIVGACVLPLITLLIFRMTKAVSSIHLTNASERKWPFVLFALSFYGTKILLAQLPIRGPIEACLVAAALALIICSLLVYHSKISIHSLGAGGLTAFMVWMYLNYHVSSLLWIFLTILISGLIGFSRLQLKAHSPSEIYLGWALGFGVFLFSLLSHY